MYGRAGERIKRVSISLCGAFCPENSVFRYTYWQSSAIISGFGIQMSGYFKAMLSIAKK